MRIEIEKIKTTVTYIHVEADDVDKAFAICADGGGVAVTSSEDETYLIRRYKMETD